MNGHERAARVAKATKLADAVHAAGGSSGLADLIDWNTVAKVAGVKPPSSTTIDLAVQMLRDREQLEKLAAEPERDELITHDGSLQDLLHDLHRERYEVSS